MEAAKGLKQEKEKILTFTQTMINRLTSAQFNQTVYRVIYKIPHKKIEYSIKDKPQLRGLTEGKVVVSCFKFIVM